jgi:hypothetical protein
VIYDGVDGSRGFVSAATGQPALRALRAPGHLPTRQLRVALSCCGDRHPQDFWWAAAVFLERCAGWLSPGGRVLRVEIQELMRKRFEAVFERATGRRVMGFMSGNQQDPVMICGVTFLAHGPSGRRIDPRPGRPRTADWRGGGGGARVG